MQATDLLLVLGALLALLSFGTGGLLFLADTAHLDLIDRGRLLSLRCVVGFHVVHVDHKLLGLSDHDTVLVTIVLKFELLLLNRHFIFIVLLGFGHIFAHDILLLPCLLFGLTLSLLLLTLLLFLRSTLLVCSSFALSVLLALTLSFLFLPSSLGLLFLAALLFGLLLSLKLSLGLGLSGRFLVVILTAFAVIFLHAKDLHHMGRRVNAGGCSMEHLLQEEIGLFGFVTRDHLRRLAVDLLAHDKLRQ